MRGGTETRGSGRGHRRSSAANSMSEPAIDKKLHSEAISSPWTVFPFILVILAIIDLVFSLLPGGALWNLISVVVLLISATMTLSSFYWRNFLRREEEYARKLQERMAIQEQERVQAEQAGLIQLLERLHRGFSKLNFDKGLKALRNLAYEYEQILLCLMSENQAPPRRLVFLLYEDHKAQPNAPLEENRDSPGGAQIYVLAEKTYKQGLSVLADALRLTQVIFSSNNDRLEAEIVELEREIESLRKNQAPPARVEIKEAIIHSHQERLELLGQQQLRLDELLYQSNQCEASLARTRIELAVLPAGNSETSVSTVTETLQRTIDQAKEVQAELERLGF